MARFIATAFVVLAISVISVISVSASDPQLTTDFFVPAGVNLSTLNGSYFTFTQLEGGVSPAPASGNAGVSTVFSNVFPVLTGLGISAALIEYNPSSSIPPHAHPRGSELLYLVSGTLNVGVIDTTGKLYEANITAGDLFVFPIGLVHYQINFGSGSATALVSFSSSSPGVVSIPAAVFGSGIPIEVLTESFAVNGSVISELEAPFGGV